MTEWKDISSAPRDKKVLVVDSDCIFTLAYLRKIGWVSAEFQYFTESRCCDFDIDLTEKEDRELMLMEWQPTHWMPLPDPPVVKIPHTTTKSQSPADYD